MLVFNPSRMTSYLGAMAMKEYSVFLRAPELEPHNQMILKRDLTPQQKYSRRILERILGWVAVVEVVLLIYLSWYEMRNTNTKLMYCVDLVSNPAWWKARTNTITPDLCVT